MAIPKPDFPTETRTWVVLSGDATKRLDHYLVEKGLPKSRTFLQQMVRDGLITVNGNPEKPGYRVRPEDRIELILPATKAIELRPEPIPLDVVYEDRDLLVVNKGPGMVVHPAPGNFTGTLVNALLYHCRDLGKNLEAIGDRERPGIVHRLDKETSGLIVVAKNDRSHRDLSRQFKEHSIDRLYLALVRGSVAAQTGRIELSIGRDRQDRKRISARTARPRAAVTAYQVLERFPDATLVAVRPQTGRTHQIRVHFASLRHPILGDGVYGNRKGLHIGPVPIERQLLHASRLGFVHPGTGAMFRFEIPLAEDMASVLSRLRVGESIDA